MSNSIQLTTGMRNTLLSLQQTNDLLNQTSERLATGKKVNSALDNALSYFTATSHTSRASDLSQLKDAMGEAIQTIKAADAGIEGIIDLIETMKGIAKDAYSATSTEATDLAAQYNAMASQISDLAEDASYGGMNLLGSDTLTVVFNEAGDNTMSVTGFDGSATGLGIATGAFGSSGAIGSAIAELDSALATLRTKSQTLSANLSIITARQDFTTNMINALTIGADNLTAADTNEEGANMLMLQTRQSLGTTSLSLASQAAQSVLQLF
ncbi:MAG: flagellin [Syntrophaceae bacterium]|nr:flagellin [Syntrophaceae bacterium]